MPPTFSEIAKDARAAINALKAVNRTIAIEAAAIRAKPVLTEADKRQLLALEEAANENLDKIDTNALDTVQRLDATADIQDLIARVRKVNADLNKATARIRKIGKIADAVGAASDGIKKVSDKLAKLTKDG